MTGLRLDVRFFDLFTVRCQIFFGRGLRRKFHDLLSMLDPVAIGRPVVTRDAIVCQTEAGASQIPTARADIGDQDPFLAMGSRFDLHTIVVASVPVNYEHPEKTV